MKILMMGNRVNVHWPCLILVMWMAVITYSSVLDHNKLGITLLVCDPAIEQHLELLPGAYLE